MPSPPRALFGGPAVRDAAGQLQWRISHDEDLLPPPLLVLEEADEVLEEWFAGGAEQAAYVRAFGGARASSNVVEIGCGLGRLAFALRRTLISGSYLGVDVRADKIGFLSRTLGSRASNFEFVSVDMRNGFYHSQGVASSCRLPRPEGWGDVVVAMAVLTHLLPIAVDAYFAEAARVLRVGGRMVLSCYLLDHFRPEASRPPRYASTEFNFAYPVEGTGPAWTSDPTCPERMLAYEQNYLLELAESHGLVLHGSVHPGSWSATTDSWLTGQDLLVLERS